MPRQSSTPGFNITVDGVAISPWYPDFETARAAAQELTLDGVCGHRIEEAPAAEDDAFGPVVREREDFAEYSRKASAFA